MLVLALECSLGTPHFAIAQVSGGNRGGETPVPIPNTEVKTASADGTWGGTPWESRSSPGFLRRPRRASDRCGGGVSRVHTSSRSIRSDPPLERNSITWQTNDAAGTGRDAHRRRAAPRRV